MNAIILAAGRGSRMGDLTASQPKCLTQLGGKTLLEWQLQSLSSAGAQEIAIVRGYLSEQLSREGLHYFENERWAESNMVRSLHCAAPWLETQACIVSYSDIIYAQDTVERLSHHQGDIVITYDQNWQSLWSLRFSDPLSDAETFQIDENGMLTEIGSRPTTIDQVRGQYMGLLKFTPNGWNLISRYLADLPSEKVDRMDMTTLLRNLIAKGIQIHTVAISGRWYEVDSESDLQLYEKLIRTNQSWLTTASEN